MPSKVFSFQGLTTELKGKLLAKELGPPHVLVVQSSGINYPDLGRPYTAQEIDASSGLGRFLSPHRNGGHFLFFPLKGQVKHIVQIISALH